MEITNVSIIGMGALGVMLYGQMAAALPQGGIHSIADQERVARYKREGIFSNGEPCSFHFLSPEDNAPFPDLLIFATKFTGLAAAIEDARFQVGKNTTILSILNGITSEEMLAEAYGAEKVLYCVAQGMDATKVGNRLTFQNSGLLSFGEKDGHKSERVRAIMRFFDKAGIAHETPDNMMHKQWNKLMMNTGVNQASMIYGADYGALSRTGSEANLAMLAAMREAMRVGNAEGVPLDETDIAYWLKILAGLAPAGYPSMKQDSDAGRKTEVELFAGTICRLGKKHNIPTPVNDAFYAKIAEMERGGYS